MRQWGEMRSGVNYPTCKVRFSVAKEFFNVFSSRISTRILIGTQLNLMLIERSKNSNMYYISHVNTGS